jgi:hypothetical protein
MEPLPRIPGLSEGLQSLADEPGLRADWRRLAEQMRRGRFQALA